MSADLIVDVHEPEHLKRMADKVLSLDYDFLIVGDEKAYAIERKTPEDLFKSVVDGRLWNQLKVLSELENVIPILVVEGNLWRLLGEKKITTNGLLSILAGIAAYKVSIVSISSEQMLIRFLKLLKHKAGKKTTYKIPTVKKKDRTLKEEKRDMWLAIQGVGQKTAEKLAEFTFKDVINDLKLIKDLVSEKVLKHIGEVLST